MAIAIRGAVLLTENATSMEWSGKCERCGAVENSVHHQGTISSGSTQTERFRCVCGNEQEVVIKGSPSAP